MRFSQPSADFCLRLCLVSSLGRSQNVAEGYWRVTRKDDVDLNQVEKVEMYLSPIGNSIYLCCDLLSESASYPLFPLTLFTACVFNKGTRLRLHIASGAHPHYHPNNGTVRFLLEIFSCFSFSLSFPAATLFVEPFLFPPPLGLLITL